MKIPSVKISKEATRKGLELRTLLTTAICPKEFLIKPSLHPRV